MLLNNHKYNINKLNNLENLQLIEINKDNIYYFKDYNKIISDKKKNIDNYNINDWDKMKKIINPYELIYTTSSNKYKYDNISYYKPVSRSYFKLWEIHKDYNIIPDLNKLNIATLAEGPGGFLEAIINLRKINKYINYNDSYYGITLYNLNKDIPEWSLKNNQCLKIFYGDLYNYNTTKKFIDIFNKNKVDLVTADGGFDYSNDFNGQEINSIHIIFSEIIHAFLILKKNGNFLCKFFDLYSKPIIKIIYILYSFFDEIYIIKPKTSRPANSEKYILCKNFKGINDIEYINLIYILKQYKDDKYYDFNIELDHNFIKIIDQYNLSFINNQIYHLNTVFNLYDQNKLNNNYINNCLKKHIICSINWCNKYNIPINKKCKYLKYIE